MSSVSTRRAKNCAVLGAPSQLKKNVLPTIKDVLLHILYSENQMTKSPRPNFDSAALEVKDIWQSASIPSVSIERIIGLIKKHYNTRRLLLKTAQSHLPETPKFKLKKETFRSLCENLFDIAACKCKDFHICSCIKDKKVSINLNAFV